MGKAEPAGGKTAPGIAARRPEAGLDRAVFHTLVLRGANAFSRHSVILISMTGAENATSEPNSIGAAAERLGLPRPADPEPAPTLGRSMASLVDSIRRHLGLSAIEIDATALPAGRFAVPLDPEELARPIAELAIALAAGRADGKPAALLVAIENLRDRLFPHVHMTELGRECWRRGVPWRRLPWNPALHQLGEGSRQCRLDLTITSQTGRLATGIAGDKAATNRLLARFGVPVPRQLRVKSPEKAWTAALSLGLPVVVKPRRGNKGQGVSVKLARKTEVLAAFQRAAEFDETAVVESYIEGTDHRILVAGGRVVAAAKRLPAHVVGDGRNSIRQLVAIENRSPWRSKEHKLTVLKTIDVDTEMARRLAAQGLGLDSVPRSGQSVPLRFGGNLSQGATAVDVTDAIHPENARMMLEATALVGLDIAGIDFLTSDITVPWHENGAAICEINSRVATRAHMAAELGTGKSVIARLLDAIYPAPNLGRIPTVLVHGGPAAAASALAAQLGRELRLRVALASADKVALSGFPLAVQPKNASEAHALAIEHPSVDLLVMEVDPDRIGTEGLGVSRADVICLVEPPDPAEGNRVALQRAGGKVVPGCDPDAVARILRETGSLKGLPAAAQHAASG